MDRKKSDLTLLTALIVSLVISGSAAWADVRRTPPKLQGPGFISLPDSSLITNERVLVIHNYDQTMGEFDVESINDIGELVQVDTYSVAPEQDSKALTIAHTAATLSIKPKKPITWHAQVALTPQADPLHSISEKLAEGLGSEALAFTIAADEAALVVLGSSSGLGWQCWVGSKSALKTSQSEISTCDIPAQKDAEGDTYQIRMRSNVGESRIMLYAAIIKSQDVAQIIPSVQVPSQAKDSEASAPSCGDEGAAKRSTLLSRIDAEEKAHLASQSMNKARAAIGDARYQTALEDLQRALRADPSALCPRLQYIQLLNLMGKFDELARQRSILSAIAPNHIATLVQRGMAAYDIGDWDTSLKAYQAALAQDPNNCELKADIAAVYHNTNRTPDEIIKWWGNVPDQCVWGKLSVALSKKALGETIEPATLLREAIVQNAKDIQERQSNINPLKADSFLNTTLADLYRLKASLHWNLNEFDLAEQAVSKGISLAPFDAGLREIATDVAMSTNRFPEALQHWSLVTKTRAVSALFYLRRGWIYQNLKQTQSALNDYEAALKINPDYGQVFINRGLIYLESKNLDLAESDFKRAHVLLPENPWPARNLEAVAYQRSQPQQSTATETVISIDSIEDAFEAATHFHEKQPPALQAYLQSHRADLKNMLVSKNQADIQKALFLLTVAEQDLTDFLETVRPYINSSDDQLSRSAIAIVRKHNDTASEDLLVKAVSEQQLGCVACAWEALAVLVPNSIEARTVAVHQLQKNQFKNIDSAVNFLSASACRNAETLPILTEAFKNSDGDEIKSVLEKIKVAAIAADCQNIRSR